MSKNLPEHEEGGCHLCRNHWTIWFYTISFFIFYPKCELVNLNFLPAFSAGITAAVMPVRCNVKIMKMRSQLILHVLFRKITPFPENLMLCLLKFMPDEVKLTTAQNAKRKSCVNRSQAWTSFYICAVNFSEQNSWAFPLCQCGWFRFWLLPFIIRKWM